MSGPMDVTKNANPLRELLLAANEDPTLFDAALAEDPELATALSPRALTGKFIFLFYLFCLTKLYFLILLSFLKHTIQKNKQKLAPTIPSRSAPLPPNSPGRTSADSSSVGGADNDDNKGEDGDFVVYANLDSVLVGKHKSNKSNRNEEVETNHTPIDETDNSSPTPLSPSRPPPLSPPLSPTPPPRRNPSRGSPRLPARRSARGGKMPPSAGIELPPPPSRAGKSSLPPPSRAGKSSLPPPMPPRGSNSPVIEKPVIDHKPGEKPERSNYGFIPKSREGDADASAHAPTPISPSPASPQVTRAKVTTQYGQLPGSTKSAISALKEGGDRRNSGSLKTDSSSADASPTSHVRPDFNFFFFFFETPFLYPF